MKEKLKGKKTYIFGVLAIVAVILNVFELVDYETLIALLGIFLSGEGMALRAALKK